MKQLISIVMPFKNAELFLKETVSSILKQTYENWELLAVNDKSTDNSVQLIKEYYKDVRIKVLNSEGDGIIDALKLGFENSKGAYITRMDADDIMEVSKLKELQEALETAKTKSVAVGLVDYFKSDGSEIGNGYLNYQNWINELAANQASFNEIYKECPIPSPSWMMKTEEFKTIGGFDSKVYPEDYELAFRMYAHNLKVIPTKNKVHRWRDYATRSSRTDQNYQDNRFLSLKVRQFINLDFSPAKKLVLLGAGRKGKTIAKLLDANSVHFEWRCGTPSKIGHVIYDKLVQSSEYIPNNSQIIVAIAANDELIRIKAEESKSNLYYYFC